MRAAFLALDTRLPVRHTLSLHTLAPPRLGTDAWRCYAGAHACHVGDRLYQRPTDGLGDARRGMNGSKRES